MSPRSRLFLRDIPDAEDRGVYGDEISRSKTINGIPFQETNNIPNNLGGGSNQSSVILVDAAQIVVGDVDQVMVDRSSSVTINIDGQPENLFEHDMSAVRCRMWNDIILRHSVGCAVIEQVRWEV